IKNTQTGEEVKISDIFAFSSSKKVSADEKNTTSEATVKTSVDGKTLILPLNQDAVGTYNILLDTGFTKDDALNPNASKQFNKTVSFDGKDGEFRIAKVMDKDDDKSNPYKLTTNEFIVAYSSQTITDSENKNS